MFRVDFVLCVNFPALLMLLSHFHMVNLASYVNSTILRRLQLKINKNTSFE